MLKFEDQNIVNKVRASDGQWAGFLPFIRELRKELEKYQLNTLCPFFQLSWHIIMKVQICITVVKWFPKFTPVSVLTPRVSKTPPKI